MFQAITRMVSQPVTGNPWSHHPCHQSQWKPAGFAHTRLHFLGGEQGYPMKAGGEAMLLQGSVCRLRQPYVPFFFGCFLRDVFQDVSSKNPDRTETLKPLTTV